MPDLTQPEPEPVHTDPEATLPELLDRAAADYATAQARSEPRLPELSPELAALAAEADALAEGRDQ